MLPSLFNQKYLMGRYVAISHIVCALDGLIILSHVIIIIAS